MDSSSTAPTNCPRRWSGLAVLRPGMQVRSLPGAPFYPGVGKRSSRLVWVQKFVSSTLTARTI